MIKRILEWLIIIVMVSYVKFCIEIDNCYYKIEGFYEEIKENGIDFIDENKVYLVFDYSFISSISNCFFSEYDVQIIKNNEVNFTLNIIIKEVFFVKEINESYVIAKGDIYEEFN